MSVSLSDPGLVVSSALIDGQWGPAASGRRFAVENPADGSRIASVPDCGRVDTEAAIAAAEAAWPAWRARPAADRGAILDRWYRLVLANASDLAALMTAENGKPLAEAEGEVRYAASFLKWFADEAQRIEGREIASPDPDRRIFLRKEPVGVAAAITPWNFPAAMITRKCAPALAAGCTMVLKPSELTPLTALALTVLAERAGVPAGVLNVVTGTPGPIGNALCESAVVRKLSFTGSTRIGAQLMRRCAGTIKRLSLELGGNAPLIVFDDADLDLAVAGVMASKFRNAGQTCVCPNRIFVQSGVHDRFVAALGDAISALRVGPGTAQGSTIGPLINGAAIAKVHTHLSDALARGARVAAAADNPHDPGRFATPRLLVAATPDMQLAQEETFGPIAPVFRFGSEAEVVALANATPSGLAGYFYTRDLARAFRVGEALEAGMVAVNTGTLSLEVAPFGGIKQSGLGREGAREGLEEYLDSKTLHIAGLARAA